MTYDRGLVFSVSNPTQTCLPNFTYNASYFPDEKTKYYVEYYHRESWFIIKILNSDVSFNVRYFTYLSLMSKDTIKQLFIDKIIKKDILDYLDKYTSDNLYRRLEIECNCSTNRDPFYYSIWNKTYKTNHIYKEVVNMSNFS
jgi:hypothetical protein